MVLNYKHVLRTLLGMLFAVLMGTAGFAADFKDPTWPCIQKKVERLSIGLLWPHPRVAPQTFSEKTQQEASRLAEQFALRRLTLEEIRPQLTRFVAENKADIALLGYVFELVFARMSNQRRAILQGIESFSLKQIALAQRVEATRIETDRLLQDDPIDHDRVDELEEQLGWDERVYTDRQKTLTYVCETPVLLQKRLYAIAQMLAMAESQ